MSGSERVVSCLASHIAACRGRATARVRRSEIRSACFRPKCSDVAFWMSSTVIRFSPPRRCGPRKACVSSSVRPPTPAPARTISVFERAFQLAHAVGEAVGQELQHFGPQLRRDALLAAEQRRLALQDAEPQRAVGRLDAADQAGREVRAQPRVDLA